VKPRGACTSPPTLCPNPPLEAHGQAYVGRAISGSSVLSNCCTALAERGFRVAARLPRVLQAFSIAKQG
jgi:hypothetical protein